MLRPGIFAHAVVEETIDPPLGRFTFFNVIGAEGAANAQALAGNISEALITTASGMIVGIPAMFFFFFFKNKYGKITSRVARVVGDLQFTLCSAVTNHR